MIPELLATALAFYRAPGHYAQLRDARVPLPPGVTDLLAAHAHALGVEQIDDTAARLGCSPEECRAAVIFFIKQALLEARGDHYRTLGVSQNADSALIRQHYHYLIRLFHPDRDLDSEGWETLYAPVINEAWNQLRTPAKRSQYDASLPQADAFDAVLARGNDSAGGEGVAGASRAMAPGARAGASALLAGLPPRLVLGLVFGLPLLLVLLWLLARPAPQNLRMAEQDMVLPEAKATALPALDAAQLGAVVTAFARSYEAGNVQHFSALFAANAYTSDARGRDEIRALYRGFFARPETREIRFGEMFWEYYGPFRSRGTGLARVTTAPLDGGEPASGELMITLEVEQTAAGPSIVVLYYH